MWEAYGRAVELTTDQKGAIAETAVAHAATRLGLGVSRPVNEGERYDLILDLHPGLLRVQVKWAPRRGEVVTVRCQSARRARHGLVTRGYSASDVDGVAAYCAELDRCFFLPIALVEGQRLFHLRLSKTRNGQRAGILWAAHFDFSRVDWSDPKGCLGAIAQLEERLRGTQEVAGSSPASSISSTQRETTVSAHDFRNRFGLHLERAAAGRRIVVTRHGTPCAELGPVGGRAAGQAEMSRRRSATAPATASTTA